MASLTSLPLVSKLSSKVIRILGCNPGPMTLQGTNTYLVGTGPRRVLIDSGQSETAPAYLKILDDVLKKENATIEHLLVTHWHRDHIGGVNNVQQLLSSWNPNSGPATVWKFPRVNEEESECTKHIEWQPLADEQTVEVEGATLRVKHTPGHTTDHVCFVLEEERTLFSGDCILGEGTSVFEDLHDYLISLNKIISINPKTIYPGHGPVLDDPIPRIQFYIDHRLKRESQIINLLRELDSSTSITEMEIVQKLYKETPKHLWPAAADNVKHHLEKLYKEGRVRGQPGEWYRISSML